MGLICLQILCLHIQTNTGKIFNVTCDEDASTIQTVKEAIQEAEGIPPSQQCLFTGGKICMSKGSIKAYKNRERSRLHM